MPNIRFETSVDPLAKLAGLGCSAFASTVFSPSIKVLSDPCQQVCQAVSGKNYPAVSNPVRINT
jgi:hypothetical protein